MTKTRTDMTVSVRRENDEGQNEIKIYRVYREPTGALFIRMNDTYVRLTEVVDAFKEVVLNA